jgi:hypothetical protein
MSRQGAGVGKEPEKFEMKQRTDDSTSRSEGRDARRQTSQLNEFGRTKTRENDSSRCGLLVLPSEGADLLKLLGPFLPVNECNRDITTVEQRQKAL